MRAPTEVLKSEHRVIEKVVEAMARVGQMLSEGKRVDPSLIEEIVKFMGALPTGVTTGRRRGCYSSGWSTWASPKRAGP